MRQLLFVFILIVIGVSAAYGVDKSKITTQKEMNEYAKNKLDKANNELNELYILLMEALDDEGKEKLASAQEAWIIYRDLHCEFASYKYKGGTMYYMVKFSYLREITDQRIAALRAVYEEHMRLYN